ncbi:MAG TPA: protein kinase [Planctomycetota bacterium]|nr:protein kinase [Planctomycetota bacterium]
MVAPGQHDGDAAVMVQNAVEKFVDRHTAGQTPDLFTFVTSYAEELRPKILAHCREFLAFDGFVGEQQWEAGAGPEPGARTFGDFLIQEELGRGGMGIVYLAHQRSLNRRVALKVMQSGLTLSRRHVERFRREATAAAQLRHPGIVSVHSFTEVDGTFALAMDYVAGRNLADLLDDLRLLHGAEPGPVEGTLGVQPQKGYVAECAILCAQLASALSAAHQAGIAHRDLKPRNVMIDDSQRARLLDFGLAKSLQGDSISMSGEITGTAHYMSPEQTLAKRVVLDHRTDIFSLGVILYELLTLRRPFDGKNLQQIVYEICFKEPAPIQRQNPKVPRDLVTVCMKALEKDPQNRYQTAAEFEADLQRFLRWEPIHARPAGPIVRLSKWLRRHRTESLFGALLITAAVATLAWFWIRGLENAARSRELLLQGQRQCDAGNHDQAIQSATEAVALLPDDDVVRAKLKLFQKAKENFVTAEQRDRADSNRLATHSSRVLDYDRELGLLLALEAVKLADGPEARSAVLHALGSGFVTHPLAGHDHGVYQARFRGDGQLVATLGTEDAEPILWDADSGAQLARLQGHGQWVVDIDFQPGGDLVATASIDGTARLWRVTTGTDAGNHRRIATATPVGTLPHGAAVELVQFAADGKRLLTICNDARHRALVFDVATRRQLAELGDHPRRVELAALSPNGALAITWGDAGFLRLWQVEPPRQLAELRGLQGQVTALGLSADGQRCAAGDEQGNVQVFTLPAGTPLCAAQHSARVTSVAFGKDDTLLTASEDHTARLWDLASPAGGLARELHIFTGHGGAVASAGFDGSGQYVVTAGEDRRVMVFDAGTSAELARLEVGDVVKHASFDAASRRVLVLPRGLRALLWDFTDTIGTVTLPHPNFVRFAGFAAPDRVVTVCDEDARIWNARTGQQLDTIDLRGDPVLCADLDPSGQQLVIGTEKGAVVLYGVNGGRRLFAFDGHQQNIRAVQFASAADRIVTASSDHTVRVWNKNDASLVRTFTFAAEMAAAAIAPDGSLVATVQAGDHAAELWSVASGERVCRCSEHNGEVHSVAFRPDGKAMITAGNDSTARIHDGSGRLLSTISSDRPLQRAVFASDGRHVLTGGSAARDHVAQVWDAFPGADTITRAQLSFTGHHGPFFGVAFAADGALALTSSRDRTARLWPTDPVAIARRLLTRELTAAERSSFAVPATTRADK